MIDIWMVKYELEQMIKKLREDYLALEANLRIQREAYIILQNEIYERLIFQSNSLEAIVRVLIDQKKQIEELQNKEKQDGY